MVKKYSVSFQQALQKEETIKNFLFEHSNIIRLTEIHWSSKNWNSDEISHLGGSGDAKFRRTSEKLQADLLKQMSNRERFNDVEQNLDTDFNHYFYRLSDRIKKFIDEEWLYFTCSHSNYFYGLEDPTFYYDDRMIGSVISHEPIVMLYIEERDKDILEQQGVQFD
jgi:hypothetical protein